MEPVPVGDELNIAQNTHEGMSGKRNEDFLGVFAWQYDGRQKLTLGIVADGVGGQIAGEVASRLTVDTMKNYFDGLARIENINKHLEEAILAANKAVYQASRENPDYRGMSTTIAVTAIIDNHLFTAHVGDSRIYLFRDGRLRQMSTDHTWAQEAIEAGLLSPEQAKKHPNRNVIRRHLGGTEEVEVDHRLVLEPGQSPVAARANQGMILREGDTLLICSDGLTDMITDQSVLESLHGHYFDLDVAASELIDKANQAGGKDNITVVIVQEPPKGPPPPLVVAPTVASSTPKPEAVATVKTAPPPLTPAAAPAAAGGGGSKLAIFVIGGVVIVFLMLAAVVGIFIIGGSDDNGTTPEGATLPAIVPENTTYEPGAPATASFLTSESGGNGTAEGSSPLDTPELIPTLRATLAETATSTRRVLQATSTPEATDIPTNTPSPGEPPPPTDAPPPPTNTSPPPTNTSAPPTNTPTATNTVPPTDTPTPTNTVPPPLETVPLPTDES
jgi:protein phosphatase